jgi:ADP-ribose pyrophosphatase YjhB (NUDIX family)
MRRCIRYQGAIIRSDHILLVKHAEHKDGRSYWIIPGGGREVDETEEECVRREMLEETGLYVIVEQLLLDEETEAKGIYSRHKTYLCRADDCVARPGYEPEPEFAALYAITEIGWFDLRSPATWDSLVKSDHITYSLLKKIQTALGYATKDTL